MTRHDLLGQGDFLVAELDAGERVHDLADDVVAGEAVEAERDEVQRHTAQLVVVDAVEREDLVVDRVQRFAQDARLHLVTFVRQQLELHVRVGGLGVRVLDRQVGRLDYGDDQRRLLLVVRHGEADAAQLRHLEVVLVDLAHAFFLLRGVSVSVLQQLLLGCDKNQKEYRI